VLVDFCLLHPCAKARLGQVQLASYLCNRLSRGPRDADRLGLELRVNDRRLRVGLDNFFRNTSIMTGEGWEVSTKTG